MARPELNGGTIEIRLEGFEITLVPTLQAAISLTSASGGLAKLNRRIADLEFDAIRSVIVAGMDGKRSKDLDQLIFDAGLISLSAPCITFLHLIANGGKPLGTEDDEEGSDTPLANSSQ